MATQKQRDILAEVFEKDPNMIDGMLHIAMMFGDFDAATYIADTYAEVLDPVTLSAFEEVRPMIQQVKAMEALQAELGALDATVPEGTTIQ